MATTWNKLKSGAPVPALTDSVKGTHVIDLDFASTADGNIASGDTWQIMPIPKNMWITDVLIFNTAAEGGAGTVDILVTGGTTFINDFNVNSVSGMDRYMNPTTTAAQTGQLYTAADTLDLLANAALDAAKVRIVVEYVMTQNTQV